MTFVNPERCGYLHNKNPKIGLLGHMLSLMMAFVILVCIAGIFNFFEHALAHAILPQPAKASQATTNFAVQESLGDWETQPTQTAIRANLIKATQPAWRAKKVKQSVKTINIAPGKAITVWVEFKNTGRETWHSTGDHFVAMNVTDPSGRASIFQHDSWKEYYYRPTRLRNKTVKPGETARFKFALQAPNRPGKYKENFHLVAENLAWIEGGKFSIPVNVSYGTGSTLAEKGPSIQIGLYQSMDPVMVTSSGGSFDLQDASGKKIQRFAEGEVVTLSYNNGTYTAQAPQNTHESTIFFQAKANGGAVIAIDNYENRPAWNPTLNDNLFRGRIQLRFNEKKGAPWVINDLPLESYLRGIAEAGNENDEDYLKTLITAARTYALYHIQHPSKHAGENFVLDASSSDQVYRGFGFEYRAPNIGKAAEATVGQVVTYDGEVVVTPYFSQSDGRTRSWEEVWGGGPKGWLKSVDDPCCTGKILLGHGVGLSASGARYFAEQGKAWDWILKYYYTGITLEVWY